ncbi:hypothetical protein DCAR_0518629 [Daucus carota subsp. sativus]|uniref:Secreted protein n=1 Tax=Daucus carota subsp. sativus TaxID=79200 RepID=A0A164XDL5_DAUCS|nr:hypothetical protein DCAR_0518629 [Daucus carota subsp. sativus]
MKKASMITFLIGIILCITQATYAVHLSSATTDDPPSQCQSLPGRDTRDPLLHVPSNWRPDYAKNDPCWTPQDDKNCSVSEHVFDPDRGVASYTFTCFNCTYHMQSSPSGSSSSYSCNNK